MVPGLPPAHLVPYLQVLERNHFHGIRVEEDRRLTAVICELQHLRLKFNVLISADLHFRPLQHTLVTSLDI